MRLSYTIPLYTIINIVIRRKRLFLIVFKNTAKLAAFSPTGRRERPVGIETNGDLMKMNNLEFKEVLKAKRILALELWLNCKLADENKENRLSDALYDYYWFVHDAVYDNKAKQCFMESVLEDIRLGEVNEARLVRFWKIEDAVDELAHKLYLMVDDGELDL